MISLPIVFVVSYFTFVLSCLIVASPFNDILSEKTERIISKNSSRDLGTNPFAMILRSMFLLLEFYVDSYFGQFFVYPFF